MVVLFTNKGYKSRFGYTDEMRNAVRFWGSKRAMKVASKLMRKDDNIKFIQLHDYRIKW